MNELKGNLPPLEYSFSFRINTILGNLIKSNSTPITSFQVEVFLSAVVFAFKVYLFTHFHQAGVNAGTNFFFKSKT